ncbi:treble-clef zinc-finger protein [Glaciihabitans tibetensis]|uniref:Treble-clef zinc-finger protein n=1 Tax=Glaciihabitans tibetensis TaxID=1266600 RepID=A0A2T0VIH2_9MICO|nr:FBP domain-containing protein [Glaciihabitans tibetensis]PRY70030.1 treble-clef zinc-finger protein [Glaciihabitans tibetensis]
MKPLTEDDIRTSIVNAEPEIVARMPLPGLHETLWDAREYLGWRDPQAPQRGYIVYWRDDTPVGMVVRASDSQMSRAPSAICSLCRTQQPGHQVALFGVSKAGEAGRNGNSVGTYICADLACSTIIRIVPPASDMQPDPADIVASRAAGLLARLDSFTNEVLKSAA